MVGIVVDDGSALTSLADNVMSDDNALPLTVLVVGTRVMSPLPKMDALLIVLMFVPLTNASCFPFAKSYACLTADGVAATEDEVDETDEESRVTP